MFLLRIEHSVPNYDIWKKAFESDPVGREQMGVRRYRISRPVDDPRYVVIELEFDTQDHAEELLDAMRKIWSGGVSGTIIMNPQSRIYETEEIREY